MASNCKLIILLVIYNVFFMKFFWPCVSCTKITNCLANVTPSLVFTGERNRESRALTSRRAWQEDTVIRWITISSDYSERPSYCVFISYRIMWGRKKKRDWLWVVVKELFYHIVLTCQVSRAIWCQPRNDFSTLRPSRE